MKSQSTGESNNGTNTGHIKSRTMFILDYVRYRRLAAGEPSCQADAAA